MRYLQIVLYLLVSLTIYSCGWESESTPVEPDTNNTPVIESLTSLHDSIYIWYSTTIICDATDSDGDNLSYIWIYDGGSITGDGYSIVWNAPESEGKYSIMCRVDDGRGKSVTKEISIYVDYPNPPDAIINLPEDGAIFVKPESFTTSFTYSDIDGKVDSLAIYIDDSFHCSLKNGDSEKVISTTELSAGDHTIYGVAVDNHGATGLTETFNFFIKNQQYNIEMMPIPKGTFMMGSSGYNLNEEPIHIVSLSNDFYLSKTEITYAQFVDVINWGLDGGFSGEPDNSGYVKNLLGDSKILFKTSEQLLYSGGVFSVKPGYENYPVDNVSWHGAAYFCNILSLKENRNTLYNFSDWSCNTYTGSSAGYRLPTEAEWEYSVVEPDSRNYGWGDEIDESYAVYQTDSSSEVISKFPKNESYYLLADMNGNLSEWVNDGYGEYADEVQTNPLGSGDMEVKVIRGGDYGSSEENIRNRFRSFGTAETTTNKTGFRVVYFVP
jgi:formylglycine-generating enzyme required for sulfatase activity